MKAVVAFLALASIVAGQQGSSNSRQQSINSIEQKSGNCSANVAGVQGNVSVQVQCPGVSSKALRVLEQHLSQLLQQGSVHESELRKEIDDWKNRYLELTDRLASANIGVALSLQAKEFLDAGKFDDARGILEKASVSDEKNVDQAAEDHSTLAQVYWLQFQPSKALEQLGLAYQYRPKHLAYGTDYQVLLLREHRYIDSEKVGLQNLETCRSLAEDDPERIKALPIILNNLALVYKNTSRMKEAETELNEAIKAERAIPPDNLENQTLLAASLTNLADVHRLMSRLVDAEENLSEVVPIWERLSTKEGSVSHDLDLADVLSDLGIIRTEMRDYVVARQSLERALEIERSHGIGGGKGSPLTLGNLGILYDQMCDTDAAEKLLTEVVEVFRQWTANDPGAEEPHLAVAAKNLGLLYLSDDRPERADSMLTQALSIYEKLGQKEKAAYSWKATRTLVHLATAKLLAGKTEDANKLFQRALGELEQESKDVPDRDYTIAQVKSNLGNLYARMGRSTDAEVAYTEAISTFQNYSASEISALDFGQVWSGLADLHRSLNQPGQAEPFYLRASAAYRDLSASSCRPKYKRQLAHSIGGLAWSELELHKSSAAADTAFHLKLAELNLDLIDSTHDVDAYSLVLLAFLPILKESGESAATRCLIATDARNNATYTTTKDVAQSFLTDCQLLP